MDREARKLAEENAHEGSSIPVKLRKTVEERKRQTEVDGLLEYGGISAVEDVGPIVDRPEIFTRRKKCARCKEWKLWAAFPRYKRNADGRHSYCHVCRTELAKEARFERRWKRG